LELRSSNFLKTILPAPQFLQLKRRKCLKKACCERQILTESSLSVLENAVLVRVIRRSLLHQNNLTFIGSSAGAIFAQGGIFALEAFAATRECAT
jgi:hypothetical protein